MLLTLVLVASAAPVPPAKVGDWELAIKGREFNFEKQHSGAENSIDAAKKTGLAAEYQPPQDRQGSGEFLFQKKDGPKVSVIGHNGTSVVIRNDVAYVADFSPISTGCRVVAYSLTTGKKVWEKNLAGIGPIAHFAYSNAVAMAVERHPNGDNFALVIVGSEASGRYVEVLDLTTGKQLAHKKYDNAK